jgi:uncharacterized membrane protein YphA (DoxX/SURF4 family)
MQRSNVVYWAVTVVFAALMIVSAVPDIMRVPEAVEMVEHHLGYPPYFLSYLGVWKLLGALVVVQPRFPRLKEWAFAGLTFDLISAMYSSHAVGDPFTKWAPIAIGLLLLAAAYVLHHRRLEKSTAR